jgi:hypothetical protein
MRRRPARTRTNTLPSNIHIKYSGYKRLRKLSRNKGIIIQGQDSSNFTKLSSEWQHHTQPASAIPQGAQAPEATQPSSEKEKKIFLSLRKLSNFLCFIIFWM